MTRCAFAKFSQHLFDFGSAGQDPGEFNRPGTMGIDPDGRVLVQDLSRVHVFDFDGNLLGAWPYRGGLILPLTVIEDGTTLVPWNWRAGESFYSGLMAVARDGSSGDRIAGPDFDLDEWQLVAERGGQTMISPVRYAPSPVWAVVPSGAKHWLSSVTDGAGVIVAVM